MKNFGGVGFAHAQGIGGGPAPKMSMGVTGGQMIFAGGQ